MENIHIMLYSKAVCDAVLDTVRCSVHLCKAGCSMDAC